MTEEESFMDPFHPKPIPNINPLFQKPTPIRDELLSSEVGERSLEPFAMVWANPFPRITQNFQVFRSSVIISAKMSPLENSLGPLHGV